MKQELNIHISFVSNGKENIQELLTHYIAEDTQIHGQDEQSDATR